MDIEQGNPNTLYVDDLLINWKFLLEMPFRLVREPLKGKASWFSMNIAIAIVERDKILFVTNILVCHKYTCLPQNFVQTYLE